MGIHDRDYMNRPDTFDDSGDEEDGVVLPDPLAGPSERLAGVLSAFFHRNPRFFIYVGAALVALIVAALVTALSAG